MKDLRTVQIRSFDFDVWQKIRVEAARRRLPVAEMVAEAWRAYEASLASTEQSAVAGGSIRPWK